MWGRRRPALPKTESRTRPRWKRLLRKQGARGDMALRGRYALPLAVVPPVPKRIAVDIAMDAIPPRRRRNTRNLLRAESEDCAATPEGHGTTGTTSSRSARSGSRGRGHGRGAKLCSPRRAVSAWTLKGCSRGRNDSDHPCRRPNSFGGRRAGSGPPWSGSILPSSTHAVGGGVLAATMERFRKGVSPGRATGGP